MVAAISAIQGHPWQPMCPPYSAPKVHERVELDAAEAAVGAHQRRLAQPLRATNTLYDCCWPLRFEALVSTLDSPCMRCYQCLARSSTVCQDTFACTSGHALYLRCHTLQCPFCSRHPAVKNTVMQLIKASFFQPCDARHDSVP